MSEPKGFLTAVELRREFDASFAAPEACAKPDVVRLLFIRAAGTPYALRLDQLGGLTKDRRILPVPSRAPEMLGVAGLRGALAAVYDLAALLAPGAAAREPRWLALLGPGHEVAFAFDQIEGYREVAPSAVSHAGTEPRARALVRTSEGVRAVADLADLLEDIKRRLGGSEPRGER